MIESASDSLSQVEKAIIQDKFSHNLNSLGTEPTEIYIGRALQTNMGNNDFVIPVDIVSRRHAKLVVSPW